jgi:hypothetical protein
MTTKRGGLMQNEFNYAEVLKSKLSGYDLSEAQINRLIEETQPTFNNAWQKVVNSKNM